MSIYNWELAQCYGSVTPSISGKFLAFEKSYTEKCCIQNGEHVLSCLSQKNNGWVNSFVRIGDHMFCEDMIGYDKFILVNTAGAYSNTHSNEHKLVNNCFSNLKT